jgi:hypothetical protein
MARAGQDTLPAGHSISTESATQGFALGDGIIVGRNSILDRWSRAGWYLFVANFVQSLIFGIGIGTRGVFGTSVSAHLREKPVKFADSKWLQSFRRAVEPATSTTVAAEWLAPSDQQKIGGERVRRTPSVALQQRCPLLMTARSRACDAAPRWPKRSLCACGTLRPAPNPSRQPNRLQIGLQALRREF